MSHRKPVAGSAVFEALDGVKTIVMAANVRMPDGIAEGIMRAAKDTDSVVIFEIARSESDLSGGYTGMTPRDYYDQIVRAAHKVDYDMYVVHADHISIKKGDEEELESTRKLIQAQIDAGYTSFAIDASHLFDLKGSDLHQELSENIRCTTEMARYIEENIGGRGFGLEVEVGEIGKTDSTGRVLTSPGEATTFLTSLKENDVHPHLLAIANGSAHGNTFDDQGNLIPQVSIDLPQTRAVAKAIRDAGLKVKIAQHGITGTPRETINLHFPKGEIAKGNVGTHWQNVFFDVARVFEPELYDDMRRWTVETHPPKDPGIPESVIFGKNCKKAFKPFRGRTSSLSKETLHALGSVAYSEAVMFFGAFSSFGTATKVREFMEMM
ncbi:MAG: class II fructose-bisphosphate aldolase [Candidatus Thermoplasmatota archaeon]|nr:class II fructose-bisphosphate aldolase [Candidatus Thermoplasmatota archaeon]